MAERKRQRASGGLPAEQIEIDFVLLADFAQAANGKLTVVGAGWNILNAAQYPWPLQFGLGMGFLVPWSETNRRHNFTFKIQQSEGKELGGGGGDFEIGRQAGIRPGMVQRVVIGISGQVQIEGPGTYEIRVTCGDATKLVTFEALPLHQLPMSFG